MPSTPPAPTPDHIKFATGYPGCMAGCTPGISAEQNTCDEIKVCSLGP